MRLFKCNRSWPNKTPIVRAFGLESNLYVCDIMTRSNPLILIYVSYLGILSTPSKTRAMAQQITDVFLTVTLTNCQSYECYSSILSLWTLFLRLT